MPKISAPTVAEHRARQRAALLDAARLVLEEQGYPALTFGALADRTGLARPTVYEYFGSKDDLVVALCEREIGRQAELVRSRLEGASGPRERVAAFVRAQLDLAVEEPRLVAPPGAEAHPRAAPAPGLDPHRGARRPGRAGPRPARGPGAGRGQRRHPAHPRRRRPRAGGRRRRRPGP